MQIAVYIIIYNYGIKMTRSEFLRNLAFIPFLGIYACKNLPTEFEEEPKPDITFNDDMMGNAVQISQSNFANDVVKSGKEIIISYGADKWVTLKQTVNKAADYRHILITKQNGENANVLWGLVGSTPSIRLADAKGNNIVKDGIELEFPIISPSADENDSPLAEDWLLLTFKIFGFALAIWLGASVVRAVVSAIAFVAFNAVALSFIIIAAGLAYWLLKQIMNFMGWTIDDVVLFFKQTWERILEIFNSIVHQ
jgi:hypothetical protein